jgi:hypothetical protein
VFSCRSSGRIIIVAECNGAYWEQERQTTGSDRPQNLAISIRQYSWTRRRNQKVEPAGRYNAKHHWQAYRHNMQYSLHYPCSYGEEPKNSGDPECDRCEEGAHRMKSTRTPDKLNYAADDAQGDSDSPPAEEKTAKHYYPPVLPLSVLDALALSLPSSLRVIM